MSGGVAILLIIAVWLFVLAPFLLRGQKPIRKAGEAFDETRVVYEGGSGELQSQRRTPRVGSEDVRAHNEDQDLDLEVVDSEEVLIEEPKSGSRLGKMFSSAFRSKEDAEEEAEIIDEPAVLDSKEVQALEPAPEEEEEESPADVAESSDTYPYDDSYTAPGDLLDPRAHADQSEMVADTSEEIDDPSAEHEELSAEELEFAQRRARRGGWDPEANAQLSASRYQRRQRTLIGLGAIVLLSVVLGFVMGGWAWWLCAASVIVTALYLAALRNQVRQENELRARRIRQLRRARLGVRNVHDADLPLPKQLRRPGAVVVELDDESPDFIQLDTVYAEDVLGPDPEEQRQRPTLRVHEGRKAG